MLETPQIVELISTDACGGGGVAPTTDAVGFVAGIGASRATGNAFIDYFTNGGTYMPRIECIQNASGRPDWPWIIALVVLTGGVIAAYIRIFIFWLRGYLSEAPADRNRKLMDLANIFLWCAICGYAMSLLMFVWPAYRLLAVFLLILNIWCLRFIRNLGDLSVSFSARRLQRQLAEAIEERNRELERQVVERTCELEQARQTAIAANEAKTRFLAMISHEIRTPMTAILGFAELLGSPDASPAQRTECVRTINRHGEHLVAVINDILDLSKLEAGKMTVERVECSPLDCVMDVVGLYKPRARERGITVDLVQETALPDRISTDPTRLRQAIINLVSNAVKFTERGGVSVRVSMEPGDARQQLVVRVTDTGIGLTRDQIDRLFAPFVQADNSTTRRFGGTGLGLSITRRIAELLGGGVEVESKPGEGSTFTLRIDPGDVAMSTLVEPDSPSMTDSGTPDASVPRKPTLSGRILLADDAPDNRRLFGHHLTKAGAVVEVVADGQAALERAIDAWRRHRAFDAVILDVQMPEMDGIEAVKRLRASGYEGLVIALSADAMTEARQRGIEAGFDEYLTKPIAGSVLIGSIRAIMERRGIVV
ncbi:MAG: response regulator [Phycisphaeraceae bacterium]|nr:response regulator [Phycisphaeraceae bacterium]